jgi:hypothetical protein
MFLHYYFTPLWLGLPSHSLYVVLSHSSSFCFKSRENVEVICTYLQNGHSRPHYFLSIYKIVWVSFLGSRTFFNFLSINSSQVLTRERTEVHMGCSKSIFGKFIIYNPFLGFKSMMFLNSYDYGVPFHAVVGSR